MSDYLEHSRRWQQHKQPRRVDYTRPGFVRPPDRLPNGLTAEQDAAMDRLAEAIAEHLTENPDCSCGLCGGGPDAA